MFTVEQESDHQKVVVMDETGAFEDLEMFIDDDGRVWIRQFDETNGEFSLIIITWHQLMDIIAALNSPEGLFVTKIRNVISGGSR